MMQTDTKKLSSRNLTLIIIGQVLVFVSITLLGLILRNLWVGILAIPISIIIWLVVCVYIRTKSGVIVLAILAGLGFSVAFLLIPQEQMAMNDRLALAIGVNGFSWAVIWYFSDSGRRILRWWAVLPAAILFSTALAFKFSQLSLLNIILYVGAGTGLGLLVWGLGERLFGLIIAGSIVTSIAPGISFSWNNVAAMNALSRTGIMLVWFAMGWGILTASTRVISDKFIWWPLIPGGVLLTVGAGMYIGGDPVIAAAVLSNTGAMGILLFAVYIVLMRTKIKR